MKESCWFFFRMHILGPIDKLPQIPWQLCEWQHVGRNLPSKRGKLSAMVPQCGAVSCRGLLSQPQAVRHSGRLCLWMDYWVQYWFHPLPGDVRLGIRVGLWPLSQLHAHDDDPLLWPFRTSVMMFWLFERPSAMIFWLFRRLSAMMFWLFNVHL